MKPFEIGCTAQNRVRLRFSFARRMARRACFAMLWLASVAVPLGAAQASLSAPQQHLNDYAGVQKMSASWEQVEHENPGRILVAVYPNFAAAQRDSQAGGRTSEEHRISDRTSARLFALFILAFLLLFVVPAFLRGLVPTRHRRYGRRTGWVIHSGGLSGAGGPGEHGGSNRFAGGGAGGSW